MSNGHRGGLHQFAFGWKVVKAGKSEIACYVDGRLVENRTARTLEIDEAKWAQAASILPQQDNVSSYISHSLQFGGCWGTKAPGGRLGDLRIYDFVRIYERQTF